MRSQTENGCAVDLERTSVSEDTCMHRLSVVLKRVVGVFGIANRIVN
jgi:hypothetical protein